MRPKAVPEISYDSQERQVYNEALKKHLPFVIIDKRSEYAGFIYDMDTSGFKLQEQACAKIQKLMNKTLENHVESHSKISWSSDVAGIHLFATPSSGTMYPLRTEDCKILAKQISDIIMDKQNWKHY